MRKRVSGFVVTCVMTMDPNVRLLFVSFGIMEVIDDDLSHIVINMCRSLSTSRVALSFLKDRITHFKI